MSDTVLLDQKEAVLTLTLHRPELGNAIDPEMIHALQNALDQIDFSNTRVLVLKAAGKYFCSGAHLKWMQASIQHSEVNNQKEALQLAKLLHTLFELPIPTIALVQGNAYAGGVGFIAACDFVIANKAAEFCISEARLGLIPAIISPYLKQALGVRTAMRLSLLARAFSAEEALHFGLVSHLAEATHLNETLQKLIADLLKNGPEALRLIKNLFRTNIDSHTLEETSCLIAKIRTTQEAQEGMRAFFEKRAPTWNKKHHDV